MVIMKDTVVFCRLFVDDTAFTSFLPIRVMHYCADCFACQVTFLAICVTLWLKY